MKKTMTIATLATLAACQQTAPPSDGNATYANEVAADAVDNAMALDGAAPAPAPAVPGRTSQFTPLDPATCRLLEENKDEGPYWRRRCDGVGGYAVEWTESDLRQGLEVIAPGGGRTSLDLSSKVANGAFNQLGQRIEWRGPAGQAPDALIVRIGVAQQEGGPDRSLLAVGRLTPKPCLVAVVDPGPRQNAMAQAKADTGGACL